MNIFTTKGFLNLEKLKRQERLAEKELRILTDENNLYPIIELTKKLPVNDIAKHNTSWMKKILSLSIEQTYLVDSVNYLFAFRFNSIIQNFNGATKSLTSKIDKLLIEKRKIMKNILNQRQLNIYNSEIAKLRKKSIILI